MFLRASLPIAIGVINLFVKSRLSAHAVLGGGPAMCNGESKLL